MIWTRKNRNVVVEEFKTQLSARVSLFRTVVWYAKKDGVLALLHPWNLRPHVESRH